jgi:hypothetical protein
MMMMMQIPPALFTPALFQTKPTVQANQSSLKPTPADSFTSSAKIRQGNAQHEIDVLMRQFPADLAELKKLAGWSERYITEIPERIAKLVELQALEMARLKEQLEGQDYLLRQQSTGIAVLDYLDLD